MRFIDFELEKNKKIFGSSKFQNGCSIQDGRLYKHSFLSNISFLLNLQKFKMAPLNNMAIFWYLF
jgi:hypothetical protein